MTDSGPLVSEQQHITDEHNRFRSMATDATDMVKVVWDDEVAMVARKWAENCYEAHDNNIQRNIPGKPFILIIY